MLTTVVLAGIALNVAPAQAGIFRRWWRPAPVMAQPAPVVVAQPETGYRAFTYQPAPTYQPTRVYRGDNFQQKVFHAAGGKILGTAN